MPLPPPQTPDDLAHTGDNASADPSFKFRRLVILIALIFSAFSLLPYYPEDMDFYAGGITGVAYPYNRLGAMGAHVGWGMLMTFGLAAYFLLGIAILCSLRRLVWRRCLRRRSWEYFLAILLSGIGMSLLLGVHPTACAATTERLNIQSIPGGLVGQLFAAPGTGWITALVSSFGTTCVAILLLAVSVGVIWYYDWKELFANLAEPLHRLLLRLQTAPPAPVPPPVNAPPQPGPQENTVPESPAAPDASIGFRTRRGDASIAAARAAAAAYQTPPPVEKAAAPAPHAPPPRQLDLPLAPPAISQARPAPPPPPPPPASMQVPVPGQYTLPGLALYTPPKDNNQLDAAAEIKRNIAIIQQTLDEFRIDATVVNNIHAPQVTLFEVEMGNGVLVTNIGKIASNLAMNLKAKAIRLLLPIPGKDCAGIEVPNSTRITVTAHELFSSPAWLNNRMAIPIVLGKNINGDIVVVDLAKAPHLIVAGTTGSGKSVCMNLMIQSILLRYRPDELKLIMFDPKVLEFQPYHAIPHLITPIINEPAKVGLILRWAITEMDHRYHQLAAVGVKQLSEFNSRPHSSTPVYDENGDRIPDRLPYIVIIIDELADIMAHAQKEVDNALSVLAAKSRAAGIHMIIATQRPDAKVVTGLVKSNFPWRVALKVNDGINSRVILDQKGAESLLGNGDMLFKGSNGDPERIQGGWVTNAEIAAVVKHWTDQGQPEFDPAIERALAAQNDDAEPPAAVSGEAGGNAANGTAAENDLVARALEALKTDKRPSISRLQRRLGIGYNRAAALMDELEDLGYVGPQPTSGMREIYWDNFPGMGGGQPSTASDHSPMDDDEGDEPPFDPDDAPVEQ